MAGGSKIPWKYQTARSLVGMLHSVVFRFCTKRFKTIRKRTVRLNCAARRFAAQQRSLGRIDGYFRRLEPVVPGVFYVRDLGRIK